MTLTNNKQLEPMLELVSSASSWSGFYQQLHGLIPTLFEALPYHSSHQCLRCCHWSLPGFRGIHFEATLLTHLALTTVGDTGCSNAQLTELNGTFCVLGGGLSVIDFAQSTAARVPTSWFQNLRSVLAAPSTASSSRTHRCLGPGPGQAVRFQSKPV